MTRYTPDGTPLWTHESDVEAEWAHVGIDDADNLLAVRRLPERDDQVLHKLDPGGNPIWDVSLPHRTPLFWVDFALHPDGWSVARLPDNKLIEIDASGQVAFEIQVPGSFVSPDDPTWPRSPRSDLASSAGRQITGARALAP